MDYLKFIDEEIEQLKKLRKEVEQKQPGYVEVYDETENKNTIAVTVDY